MSEEKRGGDEFEEIINRLVGDERIPPKPQTRTSKIARAKRLVTHTLAFFLILAVRAVIAGAGLMFANRALIDGGVLSGPGIGLYESIVTILGIGLAIFYGYALFK